MALRFEDPLFLLFIFSFVLFFFFIQKRSTLLIGHLSHLFPKGSATFSPQWLLRTLRVLCLLCLVIALARPQGGKTYSEIDSDGIDMMLVTDTSRSMEAMDFHLGNQRVTRLTIVKNVLRDFIQQRPGDRLGLVIFGSESFTQCPLTTDHGVLMTFLDELETGMAGDATAMGSALGIAVKRMKDIEAKSKIVILLTDGMNTAGRVSPVQAAELAHKFDIKVYTIGVGKQAPAPFLQQTPFGKRFVYQDVPLDERTLKLIAQKTGGAYFRAQNTTELGKIYEHINKLETTKKKIKQYTDYHEYFPWFLLLALCLILMEVILSQTLLRVIP